jgi:hypothetical protein
MSAHHHLLPYERWYAGRFLERRRTRRTAAVVRTDQNYGRDGIILIAAALINSLPCQLLLLSGVLLLLVSRARASPAQIAGWLIGVGVVFGVGAFIRCAQAARAGRKFRGGRPFIRP